MFGVGEDLLIHNEANPLRRMQDNLIEDNLLLTLERFHIFCAPVLPASLQNIATKDLATKDIQESLLKANSVVQAQLKNFVEERLIKKTKEGETDKHIIS